MTRTVTALYETRAQAEAVRAALEAANLGQRVEISDTPPDTPDEEGEHEGGFAAWLGGLFGGHHDRHLYGEGLRRGHVLLAAKVEDLSETRAAEILDTQTPVDLEQAGSAWKAQGWAPPASASAPTPVPTPPASPPPASDDDGIAQGLDAPPTATASPPPGQGYEERLIGAGVRTYSTTGLG